MRLLDFAFEPVPPGDYRVETIGAPFTITVGDGWMVQPNFDAHFVLTSPSSTGPGDRDIVMVRPSNLADPDQPGAPRDEQAGDWPLDDIEGWLTALFPGVVSGEPVGTTIGGLDAVRFDVAITDDIECGQQFCVGFATNRGINDLWFDRRIGYRVWWIDGGEHSPIAVVIGDGGDPAFVEQAEQIFDTIVFDSVGPNPIPGEGNLWELGFASDVPAGEVKLPVGPGVSFEISEPHFIFQDDFFSGVTLERDGQSDIFFANEAFDGAAVVTVDDAQQALERSGITTTVIGTREVSGYEATEIDITFPAWNRDVPPVFRNQRVEWEAWWPPPDGTIWVIETPDGLAFITAEVYVDDVADDARALAEEILDTIVIGR